MSSPPESTREHDAILIPGDYQARALESRFAAQRFWHEAKSRLIMRVAKPGPKDDVLDAGCGSGTLSQFLAGYAKTVLGVDSNADAIAFAARTYRASNVRFIHAHLGRLPFQTFDRIYSIEVLEHLHAEQAVDVLARFRQLIRPGGELLLTTPNYHSFWPVIEKLLDRTQLVPHLKGDQHIICFSRSKLQKACDRSGWTIVRSGSFNGLAPFLSPLSHKVALLTEEIEIRLGKFLPNNLLFCVCRPS